MRNPAPTLRYPGNVPSVEGLPCLLYSELHLNETVSFFPCELVLGMKLEPCSRIVSDFDAWAAALRSSIASMRLGCSVTCSLCGARRSARGYIHTCADRGVKSVGDQLRGCKTQAAAAHKSANEASKAAAAAAKAHSATQSDVAKLRQEVATLRAEYLQLKSQKPTGDSTHSASQVL